MHRSFGLVCCLLFVVQSCIHTINQLLSSNVRPRSHSAVQTGPLKTSEPLLVWMTRLHVKLGYTFMALTSILNNESTLGYWLSSLDPPAPVGCQEHFHLR